VPERGGWTKSGRTRSLMSAAAEAWRRGLVDVSASNKRLFYAPLRVGTLLLADANASAMVRLLRGDAVKLAALVADDGTAEGLTRAARARKAADLLFAKGKIGEEETGDNPVRLALGLASWTPETALVGAPTGSRRERSPTAPLLLAPVTFTLIPGTRSVSTLQLTGEPELNSALRFVLRAHYKVDLDAEGWLGDAVSPDGALDPARLLKAATRLCGRIPNWTVHTNTVVDAFGSDRELMLRDLEDEELLATHPLLAAMAGDLDAQLLVRGAPLPDDGSDLAAPDASAPAAEHLVLDADASQQAVITYALGSRNLVVQGPPGTGKSQTIANLLAETMAAGKTVLFVAQKRAAVDAVMTRLEAVGLSGNVLEVFDSKTKRGNVIAQLRNSLEQITAVPVPDTRALHRDLAEARGRLVAHKRALHAPRQELAGGTVYNLLGSIAAIPVLHQSAQRLPFAVVRCWLGDRIDLIASDLAEFTALGGLDPQLAARPGWNIGTVTTEEAAARGYDAAAAASSSWQSARYAATQALGSVGLPAPANIEQARAGLQLLARTDFVLAAFRPQCLDPSMLDDTTLARMTAAFSPKSDRRANEGKIGMLERRRLRKQFRALVLTTAPGTGPSASPDDQTARAWLDGLAEVRARWGGAVAGLMPRRADTLGEARAALGQVAESLDVLATLTQHLALEAQPFEILSAQITMLLADNTRTVLPRLHDFRRALLDVGAGPVIDALTARIASGQDVDPVFAANRLRHIAFASALEHLQGADSALGRGMGQIDADEQVFRAADRLHISGNSARVARLAAERARLLLNGLPGENLAVQDQARRKRSFKSLRQLVMEAPNALLALKPCWAMSPLLVSRYLPAVEGLFDLIVFDEASQVLVPDAVPSILRGKQAVVAGDDRQLPPTTVFTRMLDADYDPGTDALASAEPELEGEPEEDVQLAGEGTAPMPAPGGGAPPSISVATGYQSILAALGLLLHNRTLLWHYRSRDERLIAVSNTEVYGGSLVTFPGPAAGEVLQHIVVPPSPGLGEHNKSPIGEVETVTELVLAHARAQLILPEDQRQSVGVIAMGRDHADRVEKSVFAALEAAPDRDQLAALFSEDADEPYFFKNIERVQGDERDSIILTVGYGTSRDGRLRYIWGPLLGEYGINRLNVAISRSRTHMTLVTSFTAAQLPETGSRAPGYQLMRAFVQFAASGGTDLQGSGQPPPMNPFEREIHDRLTATGMVLDPQFGVSGYRLDFAARHPDFDGTSGPVRHILAIECDGRTWHSGWTARERDRLRQQQLETLGWRFHRIWSTDWFRDPDAEIARARDAFNTAATRSRAGFSPAEPMKAPVPTWTGRTSESSVRAASVRRMPPIWAIPGAQITTYSDHQLIELVSWLRSDGVLRLADDEIGELLAALGLQRRGPVIVARLSAAQKTCDASH